MHARRQNADRTRQVRSRLAPFNDCGKDALPRQFYRQGQPCWARPDNQDALRARHRSERD